MSRSAQRRSFSPQIEALESRSLMSCTVVPSAGVLTITGDAANDHESVRRSFSPQIEALESRSLMSCTVVPAAGVLTITGDAANDHVSLYDDGHGSIVGSASGVGDFSCTGIKDIVIDTGAGNDLVEYHVTGKFEAGTLHTLEANLRSGDDSFRADFGQNGSGPVGGFETGSELNMKVVGEDGNDHLVYDAGGVDMVGATMKIAYYGGTGNDDIDMNYSGLVDHGGISFFAYGNENNDTIHMSMTADPASVAPAPGGFRAFIEGDDGNDNIHFDLSAPPAVSTAQMGIDGGAGHDVAITNLDGSEVTNCEVVN